MAAGIDAIAAFTAGAASIGALGVALRSWLEARRSIRHIKITRGNKEVTVEANTADPEQARLLIEKLIADLPDDREPSN
ncbi:hypothetical protein NE235_14845 [Actinoallomurus spadix]|uniref:Uncharacterized protein n=1 Tax=Actinoallomurus spadix TaxID=79912 RepID=A0ABN0WFE2_9ACTN|nr:hypothetical protein [Actinoallomurus spadix]MCO5987382.1 hypothetical protein [Actinoallomurus spadix]